MIASTVAPILFSPGFNRVSQVALRSNRFNGFRVRWSKSKPLKTVFGNLERRVVTRLKPGENEMKTMLVGWI
jgi:hypothetical protein